MSMKKHALGLLFCCLTLFTGFGIDWLYQDYPYFRPYILGGAADPKHGGSGWSQSYISLDGVILSVTRLEFPSKENTDNYFNDAIRDVAEIIERNKIYSKTTGELIGERVVARHMSLDKIEYFSIIICLDNNTIFDVESTSLRYVQEYEKKARRYRL